MTKKDRAGWIQKREMIQRALSDLGVRFITANSQVEEIKRSIHQHEGALALVDDLLKDEDSENVPSSD